jgi:hypothetical protein
VVVIALVGVGLVAGGRPATTASPSDPAVGTPTNPAGTPADSSEAATGPVGSAAGTGSLPPLDTATKGYLVLPADLTARTAAADDGRQPYAAARDQLLAFADQALERAPRPIAHLDIPDTGGPFVDDTATAYGLALAYTVSGDVRYAQGAREYIDAWVSTTTSLVNACPDSGGCQTSLIVARVVPGFVFAADLLRPSGVFSAADDAALRAWLKGLILPDLPTRDGNWGDAGTFSRAVIADYLGDSAEFAKALDEWRRRIDIVPSDGDLPDEVRRGEDGMSYTQEALQYKVALARLAELRGTDLWSYVGKQGGTLQGAIDLLASYWFRPTKWPWDANVRVPTPSAMWEVAYQHWQKPAWAKIFMPERPYGEDGHSAIRWTTLTNGVQTK